MRLRILITGSSGMLGVDLWQELKKDYELFGLDSVKSKAQSSKRFYICNICDRKKIVDIISEIKPDIVIHAAAWTDVDGCQLNKKKAYEVNFEGVKNIALACKETDAVLIYISTDFVFDGRKKRPYKESDKTNPISIYGDSKLKGEEAVERLVKNYYILRTSWLYGKNGKNFVDTILDKARSGKFLKVVNDQIGSPTYTTDLAQAIHVLLKRHLSYGTYHISNAGSVSWYEYAKAILRLARIKTKVTPISSAELARPAKRPAMSVLDNSKFDQLTRHKMRSWRNALKEYIKR